MSFFIHCPLQALGMGQAINRDFYLLILCMIHTSKESETISHIAALLNPGRETSMKVSQLRNKISNIQRGSKYMGSCPMEAVGTENPSLLLETFQSFHAHSILSTIQMKL